MHKIAQFSYDIWEAIKEISRLLLQHFTYDVLIYIVMVAFKELLSNSLYIIANNFLISGAPIFSFILLIAEEQCWPVI